MIVSVAKTDSCLSQQMGGTAVGQLGHGGVAILDPGVELVVPAPILGAGPRNRQWDVNKYARVVIRYSNNIEKRALLLVFVLLNQALSTF